MKNKVILLVTAVALVTLSFTFGNVEKPKQLNVEISASANSGAPAGGIMSAEVVK